MAEPSPPPARRRRRTLPVVAVAAGLGFAVVAISALGLSSLATPGSASAAPSADSAVSSPAAEPSTRNASDPAGDGPDASILTGDVPRVGSIAALDLAGGLSVVTGDGRTIPLMAGGASAFPAWSPDGRRIAAVHVEEGVAASVQVFTVDASATGPGTEPVTLYRSQSEPPFYLSWTPDGGRVSFLAQAADAIALRIAAADGRDPVDGTAPGAVIERGSPLYFDWIDADRLLVHVGEGSGSMFGEIAPDGSAAAEPFAHPGDFRPGGVSTDGRFVGYARAVGPTAEAEVVVSGRDASAEHVLAAYGPVAVGFDPTSDRLATIGKVERGGDDLGFPIGPLRLLDAATGDGRVLLDGDVFAFFWSPDGSTIAALRVVRDTGTTAAVGRTVAAAAGATPGAPSPGPPDIHLTFVDAATGAVRSDRATQIGQRFLGEYLPYFDQYGLSHRLWAPDGSSILIPLTGDDGLPAVGAFPVDGGPPLFSLAADAAFWSP